MSIDTKEIDCESERLLAEAFESVNYVAYGGGVIAMANGSGYEQAGPISDYIPPVPKFDVPTEVEIYRRFSIGSPAAIDMRQKWAARVNLFELTHPNITLGMD